MDKACYDTFETNDTDSEYDGKNPNKTVGQANTSNLEKCFDIDYLKHDFIKAPKPAVPVTTEKNTLNKKVQKIFTTQSVAKPTLSLFQFKVLLVVTLTTLVLLLLGGACIALLLKPEKGS